MRRISPGKVFSTPIISLKLLRHSAVASLVSARGMWSTAASISAGCSQGDFISNGLATMGVWPACTKARTISRTWTDAPLRPSIGMPKSEQR